MSDINFKSFSSVLNRNEYLRNDLLESYLEGSSGSFNLAICGGDTPISFYDFMRNNTVTSNRLMKVFWTDERMVPFDDEWSNCFYPITKWFLKEPKVKCFPVNTDLRTASDSAKDYDQVLERESQKRLDYIILGMGKDGHIASIFPKDQTSSLDVLSCKHPTDRTERISMNYRLISSAKKVVLLINGEIKKSVLEDSTKGLPIHNLLIKKDITCLYIE